MLHTEPEQTSRQAGATRWIALGVLLLALAMSLFDVTIVNLTLPSVTEGLGASPETLSWLVSGYLLGYALSLVPAGRAGDRYGHKWVFVVGVAGYVITGVMASLAPDETFLIISRVLHGIAGGLMIAPITALIHLMFDGVSRVRAFGYFAATTGLGSLVGPIVGGWILDSVALTDGWRWALAAGLPLGVLAFFLAFPLLPRAKGISSGRFDVLGMLLLSVVVVGLIAPLLQSLPSWGWISALVALVVLAGFIAWERAVERRGGTPVLRLGNFRKLPFSAGLMQTMLGFAAFTSPIYIAMATIWQWGRGDSALDAALVMLTFGLGAVIGGIVDDRFTVWFRRWDTTVALSLLAGGFLVTLGILIPAAAEVDLMVLAVPLLIAGIGNGAFIGLNMSAVLAAVPDRDAGSTGGLVVTAMRLGSAFGAAVVLVATALPAAEGMTESEQWIRNGNYGVILCTIFVLAALLLAVIVALRTPREGSAAVGDFADADKDPVAAE